MCVKDYFYSKDGEVEKVLSPLEDSQSKVIGQITTVHKLPGLEEHDYFRLLSFVCLQHSRTEASKIKASQAMKILSDTLVESLVGKDSGLEIVFPGMHLSKMKYSLQSIPLLGDLVPVLLINKTQNDFIFSDNPVVFHNTYFNHVTNLGVLGLQSPGLQIFCPLDPKHLLMLFDPKLYALPCGSSLTMEITKDEDVEQINTLQILNCEHNVFFRDKKQELNISKLHSRVGHLTGQRMLTKQNLSIPGQSDKDLIHTFETKPQYELNLSFVSVYTPGIEYYMVRSPEMVSVIEKKIEEEDNAAKSRYSKKATKI